MTTKPFDQFNKRLFQELLSPFGQVIPNLAVLGEERMIDIFFAPYPDAVLDPEALGCLAQMAAEPALLEPFRSAIVDEDVQFCLIKLFMVYADQKRENPTIPVTTPPKLWILAAEVSDRLLQDFTNGVDLQLGEGFYPMKKGLRPPLSQLLNCPQRPTPCGCD
jgi:hypothetical protein